MAATTGKQPAAEDNEKKLLDSVIANDLKAVSCLLQQGVSANSADPVGRDIFRISTFTRSS